MSPVKSHVARALGKELAFRRDSSGSGVLRAGGRDVRLEPISEEASFTAAFRDTDAPQDVYVFTVAEVADKDIAEAVHRRDPTNPHIPAFKRLGRSRLGDRKVNVYHAPFYQVPPPAKSKAEEDRLRLAVCAENSNPDRYGPPNTAETIACAKRWEVTPSVVEALEALVAEAARRRIPYIVEFHRHNTGVDAAGNLVLLDVLYPDG